MIQRVNPPVTKVTDTARRLWFNGVLFNSLEKIMTRNEGNLDRILRLTAGVVLVGLAATGTVGVWGWVGVVPLATGAMGWCPLYSVLGIKTCSVKQ